MFIPLGDETINSSLVEKGRSLMDPQPHPLLHFLVRMKPTSNECHSSGLQKCGSHKGKDLSCTEDVEAFPSQIFEAYLSPDFQYEDRRYHGRLYITGLEVQTGTMV